ncbi:helix-turn-helix transcriptional regulator [Roseomonas hellenica]|uniref:Helix-turn-helix transcriptional regulator n=1 Tax=Plastoroseomonas hellenica TaxID=2687306 RepID=A0ABS5F3C1_9PROT|nr:helix-turn-helix transcriptional regulator [Plastoroseomonas hellenica]MBR0667086.1 helix-turn-helix transcriptional regulator [Plastoroseomonas hellenica]
MPHSQTTLIDTIYSAAAHPDRWPAVLTVVADHVGATGGMLAYIAPRAQRGFLINGRLREDLGKLFLDRHLMNPWTVAIKDVPPSHPIIANSLIDTSELRRSEFYADVLAPQSVENIINVKEAVLAEGGSLGGFGFTLSARGSDRAEEGLRRLRGIRSHLSRALETSLALGRHADGTRQLTRVLHLMPGPAFLLDRGGHISHANSAAEALLRRHDGLGVDVSGGLRLAAALPQETKEISRAIATALSVAVGGEDILPPPLRLTRPSGLPPLILMLVPLPPPAFALWELNEAARAMVLVIDPDQQASLTAHAAGAAFGLTAAEARVAALIAGGFSVPEAAAALGIAPTTVKTHLLRCFDKTGVRSQSGLARLFANLPVSERFLGRR